MPNFGAGRRGREAAEAAEGAEGADVAGKGQGRTRRRSAVRAGAKRAGRARAELGAPAGNMSRPP